MILDNYDRRTLRRLLSYGKRDNNGCLIFTGAKDALGYGMIGYKGIVIRVHRLIMHLVHGFDLDSDKLILHKNEICKSKSCFDDTHLYVGDRSNNTNDTVEAGNHNQASKTHCSICKLPLEGDNLVPRSDNRRACKNCFNRRAREYYERNKLRKLTNKINQNKIV